MPVIGITKPDKIPANYKELVYITPSTKDVQLLIEAGADIIAFDGTYRNRKNDENISQIIDLIHTHNRLAMADISTLEEGINAEAMGADLISTTLAGYTQESGNPTIGPDYELLKKLVKNIRKPVILEGRIWEPRDVKRAFDYGAHCVVIGSAITRPQLITKRFIEEI